MNKKVLVGVLLGILMAAVVCIVVGLIFYLSAVNTNLVVGSSDYAQLSAAKNSKLLMGMICIIVGASCFILPAAGLLIILINYAVTAIKRRKN
jgi:hypothetical protein